MDRDQKGQAIVEVAAQIEQAEAVFAVDPTGISVEQAADLRGRLLEADATLRVVKNRLTHRSAEQAGAQALTQLLVGPTALTFVRGDVALAAKALAGFRRDSQLLVFKGGTMNGEALSVEQMEALSRLPSREQLQSQFVGVLAAPVTGLVRGLAALIAGVAVALRQIEEQGLVRGAGAAPEAAGDDPASAAPEAAGDEPAPAAPEAGGEEPQSTLEPESEEG